MSNQKLETVLQELTQERARMKSTLNRVQNELADVEDAIQSIKKIVNGKASDQSDHVRTRLSFASAKKKTNVQLAEMVLESSSHPIRMLDIIEGIRQIKRKKKISRSSIETAISRHLKNLGEESRIERLGEGMYQIRKSVIGSNQNQLFNH